MAPNLARCNKCRMNLISEEMDSHRCFQAKDVWVIDGKVWIGDGKNYYLLPRVLKHAKRTRGDEIEP